MIANSASSYLQVFPPFVVFLFGIFRFVCRDSGAEPFTDNHLPPPQGGPRLKILLYQVRDGIRCMCRVDEKFKCSKLLRLFVYVHRECPVLSPRELPSHPRYCGFVNVFTPNIVIRPVFSRITGTHARNGSPPVKSFHFRKLSNYFDKMFALTNAT